MAEPTTAPETPAAESSPAETTSSEVVTASAPTTTAETSPAETTAVPAEGGTVSDPSAGDPPTTNPQPADPSAPVVTGAGASTPTPVTDPLVDKKGKILKIVIPIIVVMILGGIAGGVSYYMGYWGKKTEVAQVVQADNSEATDSASLEPVLITPDCVSGYKPFVHKLFSICYPITMDIREQAASESASAVTEFIFEDKVETLRVLTDYKGNLNKFDCASSKVVKVATYSALRYQVRDPNPKGGCAGTINEYASMVSSGNGKPIFYIGLSRKNGSYQSDNGAFAAIEQSFRINQQ